MEARSTNALFKRAEQLKRWEESETNKECSVLKDKPRKINFTDECVFLAACSAGDKDEVKRLLLKGAYIDTANVDGLTALHQSCIDDNLDMVEFLVEHGADVNCGDNEGWTPLHATASCGFVSIAKYLIEHGANVAAVNNDGELPLDIAEQDEIEELLQDELDKFGIDCDYARNIEEHMMLEDANRMLNSSIRIDERHPKTGATALHVSAAKNYVKVLRILIQAGLDINIQDFDGWTPLHAAAHWGQREACKMLSENGCDMDIDNYAGQTAFDVADSEIISYLEELKSKQLNLKEELKKKAEAESIIDTRVLPTRVVMASKLGVPEKVNVINRDRVWDRVQNEISDLSGKEKTPSSLSSENESSESTESSSSEDSEIEKKNGVNKVGSAVEVGVTHDIGQGEQIRNKLPAVKDLRKDNDTVASIELPKVIRKEEPIRPEADNITEVVIRAVPSTVATPSFTINLPSTTTTSSATLSSSVPSTPTSANSQVRRSFVPPVRDEESETQRKAHAKRVRETRRSTQGVTLEDLKGAEQLVQKKNQESEDKNNSLERNKEENRVTAKADTTNDRDSSSSIERRPSWRIRVGREEIKPVADSQNSRVSVESPEEPTVTAIVTLSTPVNSENSSIPVYTRRTRAPVTNSVAASDVDTTVTVTLKSHLSPSNNEDDYSKDNDKDNDKENENKTAQSIQATQAAIQRRRRPKRRSTGVVQIDLEDGESEKMDGNIKREGHIEAPEIIEDQAIADKGYRSSRYGSTSSLSEVGSKGETPSKTSNRSSRAGSVGSSVSVNDASEIDYKKLYEDQKAENERLAEKQKVMEKDLEAAKLLLEKTAAASQRNASSDADRREKRALERKLSEMEEELKQFEQLKAENQRLRDENGALIRVISKLSK